MPVGVAPLPTVTSVPPSAPVLNEDAGSGHFSRLLARWPDYHERMARYILTDPLRPLRRRLAERIEGLERSGPQRDLFATP